MAIQSDLITEIQPVQPGDLITADFINSLVTAIWELEDRLSALESEGTPQAQPQPGGDGVGAVQPRVAIDFATVSQKSTKLLFEVQGSGLLPAGLKTFAMNAKAFPVTGLKGDDENISFTAPSSILGAGGKLPTLGDRFSLGSGGGGKPPKGGEQPARMVLAITTKAGAKVQRQVTVDDDGGRDIL